MTKKRTLVAAALMLAVLSIGGSVYATSKWDGHSREQLISEIETRDTLIGNQEALLNTYRCLFDVDTHIVPGGCAEPGPEEGGPVVAPAYPQDGDMEGDWTYFEFENSAGTGRGYVVEYTQGWTDSALLAVRCTSWDGIDVVFATSELLHGGDNEAQIQYRVNGGQSVSQTWWSDEELDSIVAPNTDSQQSRFLAELAEPGVNALYVTFTSVWDGDSMSAEFGIAGVQQVLANVRAWCQ